MISVIHAGLACQRSGRVHDVRLLDAYQFHRRIEMSMRVIALSVMLALSLGACKKAEEAAPAAEAASAPVVEAASPAAAEAQSAADAASPAAADAASTPAK
jgi:hypothetical protein